MGQEDTEFENHCFHFTIGAIGVGMKNVVSCPTINNICKKQISISVLHRIAARSTIAYFFSDNFKAEGHHRDSIPLRDNIVYSSRKSASLWERRVSLIYLSSK